MLPLILSLALTGVTNNYARYNYTAQCNVDSDLTIAMQFEQSIKCQFWCEGTFEFNNDDDYRIVAEQYGFVFTGYKYNTVVNLGYMLIEDTFVYVSQLADIVIDFDCDFIDESNPIIKFTFNNEDYTFSNTALHDFVYDENLGGKRFLNTFTNNGEYLPTFAVDSFNNVINQSLFLLTLDYNKVYQEGYDNGFENGDKAGQRTGFSDGYNKGKIDGYGIGYNEGLQSDDTITTIFNGIFGIALLPINMFLTMFNFEVMGINIAGIVTALLTVGVVIIIVKFVTGKKVSGDE